MISTIYENVFALGWLQCKWSAPVLEFTNVIDQTKEKLPITRTCRGVENNTKNRRKSILYRVRIYIRNIDTCVPLNFLREGNARSE